MSAFSDLLHGNFGNIGHDLAADPLGTAIGGTALAIGSAGLLAPEIFGAEAGGGLFGGLFGGGEAVAGAEAGGSALGFGADTAGAGGLDAFLAAPDAAGGADALGADTLGLASPTGTAPNIDPAFQSLSGGDAATNSSLFPNYGTGGSGGPSDASALFPGYGSNAPGPAGAPAGSPSFLSRLGTGAVDSITRNPLGVAAAGVGLGANLLRGNPTDPNQQALSQQAQQLGAQGQALQQYLANGTLPPAMQASLNQATAAAKARIVANHAKNGMSTDPTQNSALAQELSAVDTNAVGAMATAQIEMMKTGLNATGLSSQLYEMLTKMDRQNNQDTMTAIQNFAAALGGGSRAPAPARAA